MSVTAITTAEELKKVKQLGKPVAVNFWAEWCEPCKDMNAVFATLASQHGDAFSFVSVDAESGDALTDAYDVSSVPTYLVLSSDATVQACIARVDGADAARLTDAIRNNRAATSDVVKSGAPVLTIEDQLRALINKEPVMLFMKGSPAEPKCGFSAKMVALLTKYADVKFGSVDILQDQEVRNELKKYSNWPTYPQLYAGGRLLGGIDIAKEMDEEGELQSTLVGAINAAAAAK